MNRFVRRGLPIALGFAIDLVAGDPRWLPHPVRWIGTLISKAEDPLRQAFPADERGERAAGTALVGVVAGVSTAAAAALVHFAGKASPMLAVAAETVMCYQMLATRSLRDESMNVAHALEEGTIEDARGAVAMIVGRDTDQLDEEGVAKAAVETVAENASDGVVAPLLFMAAGGGPGAVFYKAVNTMDSMVGYKNERYRHFGTAAARFDDVLNFIPARAAGAMMCVAAAPAGFDAPSAWRVFKRDRQAHSSPNSAHTEAACAGALGVQLGGGNYYFGTYVEKPTIGDATRPVESADIARANRLLYATAFVALAVVEVFVGVSTFMRRRTHGS